MKYSYWLVIVAFSLLVALPVEGAAQSLHMENNAYAISAVKKGKRYVVSIGRKDQLSLQREITPTLTVFYADQNPGYGRGVLEEGNTSVAAWKDSTDEQELNVWALDRYYEEYEANAMAQSGDREWVFSFEEDDRYNLSLTLSLGNTDEPPLISWQLESRTGGWISVAFTGLDTTPLRHADFLYQPLVWSGKRFPVKGVITPEAFATTAAVFFAGKGYTEGLAVNPAEIPYRFATFENSRFGLAIRSGNAKIRPTVFAPLFGGESSAVDVGSRSQFSCYYFIQPGDWETGIQYLYNSVINYRNERKNTSVSLNQTLDNMVDYAMNDFYSGWVEELKGSDYRFDVPGTVKNVSALHPLSVALVTDNVDIYQRRALPMIEYLMSREKYLYATDENITQQNPSHFLKGPCMEINELASLHQMTGGRNTAFVKEMDRVFGTVRQLNLVTESGGATWQDYLAKYRMLGDSTFLEQAIELADDYLEKHVYQPPTDFTTSAGLKDRQASFVTDYTAKWYDLLELYEETGLQRYLDAASSGARQMLLWMRSNPFAPDTAITVNEGNRVAGVFPGRRFKLNSYDFSEYDTSTEIQQQQLEAWRTSLVGLPPEAPSTYRYGPVMLTHHAAWMLRLAKLTGDALFEQAAYNAILGRYANFPGYYFTSLYTNVYQQESYPLHPYLDVKYNAIFYNHIWPHIALIQDFLISDTYLRSEGAIDFPSAYSGGYAFLTSKVYGHLPGKIYNEGGIYPWIPKNAFAVIDPSLNYVLGRSETDTYVILMNTGSQPLTTTVHFNQDVVKWDSDKSYQISSMGADQPVKTEMSEGKLTVSVPGNGIRTFKIEGLRNEPLLKKDKPFQSPVGENGYFRATVDGLGTLTGMLISVADNLTNAYVYTDATEKQLKKMTLSYSTDGINWEAIADDSYPFEFSWQPTVSLPIHVKLKGEDQEGNRFESESYQLQ